MKLQQNMSRDIWLELSQKSLSFTEFETDIPSAFPEDIILQYKTRTSRDTFMTAGYSIDGKMAYKTGVKSELHTFFPPWEIPPISEETRKISILQRCLIHRIS